MNNNLKLCNYNLLRVFGVGIHRAVMYLDGLYNAPPSVLSGRKYQRIESKAMFQWGL